MSCRWEEALGRCSPRLSRLVLILSAQGSSGPLFTGFGRIRGPRALDFGSCEVVIPCKSFIKPATSPRKPRRKNLEAFAPANQPSSTRRISSLFPASYLTSLLLHIPFAMFRLARSRAVASAFAAPKASVLIVARVSPELRCLLSEQQQHPAISHQPSAISLDPEAC